MKKLNMTQVIDQLKEKRSVFHSEADFQFALAWQIKKIYQDQVDIHLEVPLSTDKKDRLDILVKMGNKNIPIELKYFHSELTFNEYRLSKQNDTWRSQRVLKDLERAENYAYKNNSSGDQEGYALLICNEEKYWTPKKDNLTYYHFRLEDGRTLKENETLEWITDNDFASEKALKYGDHLTFRNDYLIEWKEYSKLDNSKKGQFKYLLLEVK